MAVSGLGRIGAIQIDHPIAPAENLKRREHLPSKATLSVLVTGQETAVDRGQPVASSPLDDPGAPADRLGGHDSCGERRPQPPVDHSGDDLVGVEVGGGEQHGDVTHVSLGGG